MLGHAGWPGFETADMTSLGATSGYDKRGGTRFPSRQTQDWASNAGLRLERRVCIHSSRYMYEYLGQIRASGMEKQFLGEEV